MNDIERVKSRPGARRASVYIAVLVISMLVVVIGTGALLAAGVNRQRGETMNHILDAQLYAHSGVEIARQWIASDPNWRTTRVAGVWASNAAIGSGTYSITVSDPNDGVLANRPRDPLIIKATGQCSDAKHVLQVQLVAQPTPLDLLRYAVYTAGQLRVQGSNTLTMLAGTASARDLNNDNLIYGSVDAGTVKTAGTVRGTLTTGVPACALPNHAVFQLYTGLGTTIAPGTKMEGVTLSPTSNPYGTPNAEGVYVIQSSANMTICNVAIQGTLVIVAPSKTIRIGQLVRIQPQRSDYPALIIDGNVLFDATSSSLSPVIPTSGIRGLVHVTGQAQFVNDPRINGALIAESAKGDNDVQFSTSVRIDYDPTLYISPPQGYTSKVDMVIQPGSWMRVVE